MIVIMILLVLFVMEDQEVVDIIQLIQNEMMNGIILMIQALQKHV